MIGPANPSMYPAIKEIWRQSFGDPPGYIDFLFDRLLTPDRILVESESETPRAFLCLQPFALDRADGDSLPGSYIFGVATDPAHRGKGLSTALLEESHQVLADRGDALSALVPASESLFRFYGARGYETAFSVGKVKVVAADIPALKVDCSLQPASLEALADLRDARFARGGLYVRWPREYLAFIGAECAYLGGKVLSFTLPEGEGYAVCYPWEGSVIVKELAAPDSAFDTVLAALHRHFAANDYLLYLPADHPRCRNRVLPFAMIKWYDKNQITAPPSPASYIAHVLD